MYLSIIAISFTASVTYFVVVDCIAFYFSLFIFNHHNTIKTLFVFAILWLKYCSLNNNKNIDIKFSAHDTFLE